jgi:putative sterol carrier protein
MGGGAFAWVGEAMRFPSDDWIKELSRQLNASESYERSAKDWEGDFWFLVEPDEAYPGTAHLFLGLHHGKSSAAAMEPDPASRQAEFTLSAPFSIWRQVIEGKLDPIQGMMMRKLNLQGNLTKIMRYPRAAKEIVSCCALIPTDWD